MNNIIAGRYFNTTPYAAPIMGIVAGLIMLILRIFIPLLEARKTDKAGEHFVEPSSNIKEEEGELPNEYLSLVPLVTVVLVLYVLSKKAGMAITPASILSLLCGNIVVAVLI